MAHTEETIAIAGTKVKVAIGTYGDSRPGLTRTVNVYDHTDTEGCYKEVYRLSDGTGITAEEISQNASTLGDLDTYLMGRGAVKEGPRTI